MIGQLIRFHGINSNKLNRTFVRLRDLDEELLALQKKLDKAQVIH
jgi:hypothetical protein